MVPKGWKEFRLGECADINFSGVDKKTNAEELPVKLCNYTDVYYNSVITTGLDFMAASATEAEIEKFTLREGDVLITKDSETADDIAVPAYVAEDIDGVLCGYHLALIRPHENILCGKYLSMLLQTHFYRHYFYTLANGVTRFGLTTHATIGAHVLLPPFEEQEKLAEILGKWDTAIEKTAALITAKQKLKMGLMQKLLTGKVRFKEFRGQKWHKTELGDFLKPVSRPVPRPDAKYIAMGLRSHGKGTFLRTVDDPETVIMDTLYEVRKDDLIVNITFAWEGAIALVNKSDEGALVSHRFPTYTFKRDKAIPEYFRHVILTKRFVHQLGIISPGGAGRNRVMSKRDFLELVVSIPPVAEQKRIAAVLNGIDGELDLLERRLEALKKQKTGLMQKLLTGKKRVKV